MSYREATFYFYTGTGNSYRVIEWMAGAAREAGAAVTVRPIEAAHPAAEIGAGETALLGLTMPTHGFTAPWAMLRFVLRLPRRRGTHAVVSATRAGSRIGPIFTPGIEGSGAYLIALILALKGYRVRGTMGIDMPSSWIALHPALAPRTVSGIIARAQEKTARFMEAVLGGRRRLTGWGNLVFGLIMLPLSLAYMVIGRLFLAKLFFASADCTGCGLCAEHCPNGAIEMRGTENPRPYWTFRCESCMRCMAFCPTRAVEASHLLAVSAYLVPVVLPLTALLGWLAARAPLLAFLNGTPRRVLEWFYPVIALGLAYPLFHLALQIPWVNRFFTLATLTHYYRRYHEPGTKLKDLT